MGRYLGRRLLQIIPVMLGATLLIYALVFLMPGDPIQALGGDRGLSEAAAAAMRRRYHLDQPFIVQYLLYLKGIFTLDFGLTFSGREVTEVMASAFPVTIKLALMALAFEAIFGIVFGTIAGLKRGGVFGRHGFGGLVVRDCRTDFRHWFRDAVLDRGKAEMAAHYGWRGYFLRKAADARHRARGSVLCLCAAPDSPICL